ASGNSSVGTYMSKAVSDHLATRDVFSGEANVQGRIIYCLYKNMRDYSGKIIGAMVVGRSVDELKQRASSAQKRATGILVAALTMVLSCMLVIITKFTSELTKTKGYLEKIGTGNFPEYPLEVNTKDEIQEMAEIINDMTVSLKEKQRIGAELSVATDLQANILPTQFPAFPDRTEFDVFATMTPAKEVGGDFYDYFLLDEKHIVVLVADVSGKGVGAAFFMAIAKTIIRTYARMGLKPEEVFSRANRALCQGNSACLFVTSWMGVLNLESGVMTYVNAGHNPPLLKHANGDFEYLVSKPNFVLAGFETTRYIQHETTIEPGAMLYLYTDGAASGNPGPGGY
nr:SpoIIE family protein phosphatase [Acidaminococcaceae bacterium]